MNAGPDDLAGFRLSGLSGDVLPLRINAARRQKGPLSHPVEGFRMAVVRRLILALVVGLVCSVRLGAQVPTGTISGRVVDAASQQPVADVAVVVEGTRRGAVTGADGTFIIVGVPAGSQTVRARRIGFAAPVQIAGACRTCLIGCKRSRRRSRNSTMSRSRHPLDR